MGFTSPWHWAIVLVVLVLLFGSKRLPDAARGIGRSLRIFKSEIKEMSGDDKPAPTEDVAPPAQLPPATVATPVVPPQAVAPQAVAPQSVPQAAATPTAPTPTAPTPTATTENPGG